MLHAGVCNGDGSSCFAEFEFSCEVTSDEDLATVIVANSTLSALTTTLSSSLDIDRSRIVSLDLSVDATFDRRRLLQSGFITLWIVVTQSAAGGLVGDQATANAVRVQAR